MKLFLGKNLIFRETLIMLCNISEYSRYFFPIRFFFISDTFENIRSLDKNGKKRIVYAVLVFGKDRIRDWGGREHVKASRCTNFIAQSRRFTDGGFEMHDARRHCWCTSQRGALMQRETAEVLETGLLTSPLIRQCTQRGLVRTCLFSSSL